MLIFCVCVCGGGILIAGFGIDVLKTAIINNEQGG